MTQLSDILQAVERLWPVELAQSWDASGLIVGDPADSVSRVLLAVDAVSATVDEAVALHADLLLSHHPLLFHGVTTVAATTYRGAAIRRLTLAHCALLAAHTNADSVTTGTSAVLARVLGLTDLQPLDPGVREGTGIGCVGRLPHPSTLGRVAAALAQSLPATAQGVAGSGDYDAAVATVAICAGAGDSLLQQAADTGADVYVTADLRHHPALDAREQALTQGGLPYLINLSHWASEWVWLEQARMELAVLLPEVEFVVSDLRTDPWDFVVTQ